MIRAVIGLAGMARVALDCGSGKFDWLEDKTGWHEHVADPMKLEEKALNMETHFEAMEQAHSHIARERVLQDFKTLARDAEDLLKVTASDMSVKGKELRARLQSALARARATCADLQDQAVASAKAAAKKADTAIRDHPYESIGVAFGGGVLLGVLIARKK